MAVYIFVVAAGVAVYVLHAPMLDLLQDLQVWGREHPWPGGVLVVLLLWLACLAPVLPASAVAIAAGIVNGAVAGTVVCTLALLTGAMPPFLLARHRLRRRALRWLGRWAVADRFDRLLEAGGWRSVGLLRLSATIPFCPLSYALGLSAVRTRDYLIGNLGALPSLAAYVLLGASLGALGEEARAGRLVRLALAVLAVIALSVLTVYLRRLVRRTPGSDR